MRRLLVATALAVALLAGCYGGARPLAGMNQGNIPQTPTQRASDGAALAGAAGWARVPLNQQYTRWGSWEELDNRVSAMRTRGVRILCQLADDWDPHHPSGAALTSFAQFAVDVERRYGCDVIEPGNEPELLSFNTPNTPEAYLPTLQAVVYALHRNGLYPQVMAASFSPVKRSDPTSAHSYGAVEFAQRLMQLGAGPLFQQVGYHVYPAPHLVTESTQRDHVRELGQVTGKPVSITEVGYATCRLANEPRCGSEARQVEFIRNLWSWYRSVRYGWGLGPLYWFSLVDYSDANTWQGNAGLIRRDRSKKPGYYAWQQEAAA